MKIITEILPKTIIIEDKEYPINTDFRTWIEIEKTIMNPDIEDNDKLMIMLYLAFRNDIPQNIQEALDQLTEFYNCNDITYEKTKKGKDIAYSYEVDEGLIFSAFMQQYNIDLDSIEYMHWFKYKALFDGLTEDTLFIKIVGYRTMDLSQIKDKEQRQYYKKLKDKYRIKRKISKEEEELNRLINERLKNGESIEDLLNN